MILDELVTQSDRERWSQSQNRMYLKNSIAVTFNEVDKLNLR